MGKITLEVTCKVICNLLPNSIGKFRGSAGRHNKIKNYHGIRGHNPVI